MHHPVLVFTTQSIESKMEQFCFDHDENNVFEESLSAKEAKKEYKEFMSNPDNFRDNIQKFVKYKKEGFLKFHEEENGYSIVDGKLGYYSNPVAFYDWFEVGGRWDNMLPTIKKEFVNDAPIHLVDIEVLINEKDVIFAILNINDEYEEIGKTERKEKIKEAFADAIEWGIENGEEVWVYIVDCHS